MRRVILALLLLAACGGPPPERATPRAVTTRSAELAPPAASTDEAPLTIEHPTIDPSCAEHVASGALQGPNAQLVHGSDAGLVFRTQATIPGQQGHHLPAARNCYSLSARPGAAPRPVFSIEERNPPAVAGVVRESVVLVESGGEVRLARADGSVRRFRGELDGELAFPIAAYDDGVLLQRVQLNEPAPLTFVPWSETGLALARRVEVASAVQAPMLREPVCRAGDRLVWAADALHVFDLATRALRSHPIGAPSRLAACDDELAVLRGGVVGGQRAQPAFVIATGAALPARLSGDAIAVRHRYAYVVEAASTSIVSYDLRRYDLEADGAVEHAQSGLPSGRAIALSDALYFVEGAELRRVEWATR
jgi:hypothetical protein